MFSAKWHSPAEYSTNASSQILAACRGAGGLGGKGRRRLESMELPVIATSDCSLFRNGSAMDLSQLARGLRRMGEAHRVTAIDGTVIDFPKLGIARHARAKFRTGQVRPRLDGEAIWGIFLGYADEFLKHRAYPAAIGVVPSVSLPVAPVLPQPNNRRTTRSSRSK